MLMTDGSIAVRSLYRVTSEPLLFRVTRSFPICGKRAANICLEAYTVETGEQEMSIRRGDI